jgi:hypothetical protein
MKHRYEFADATAAKTRKPKKRKAKKPGMPTSVADKKNPNLDPHQAQSLRDLRATAH